MRVRKVCECPITALYTIGKTSKCGQKLLFFFIYLNYSSFHQYLSSILSQDAFHVSEVNAVCTYIVYYFEDILVQRLGYRLNSEIIEMSIFNPWRIHFLNSWVPCISDWTGKERFRKIGEYIFTIPHDFNCSFSVI